MGIEAKNIDLSVDFGKFKLQNPVMTASGTFGYCDEFDAFLNVKNLGAIVTKGVTLEERPGNEGRRIFECEAGMINRIGLENVGIEKFISKKLPELNKKGINFVLNIAGSSVEDYVKLGEISQANNIRAIEINVSCPNVKSGCLEFGTDEKCLYELISRIREVYNGFLIVKLTPNVTEIEKLAIAVEKAGADCISAINTLKGLGVELNFNGTKVSKSFVQGGLSGKCVKPVALSMVKRIKEAVSLPIIGLGGISCLKDLLEFVAVGADAVQIGTENFTNPDIAERLTVELAEFIEKQGFKSFNNLKEELRK
ncbi:MAG: dihydroorotate dehydrogenase [Candidatus Gastranaerophilales bacterium]|nr:dihydroorotate dehydrogenase [Candidatus Gastranaerophilales bacterium]